MKSFTRRSVLTGFALAAGSLATGCGTVAPTARTAASTTSAAQPPSTAASSALRTRAAPFTGTPPRVVLLRDSPLDAVGQRWLAGAQAQAALAHMAVALEPTAVDDVTFLAAFKQTVDDEQVDAVILTGAAVGVGLDLSGPLAKAATRGLPVVAQAPTLARDFSTVVRGDDAQLVRAALSGARPVPDGSAVALVAPTPGYGRIDRRCSEWSALTAQRTWHQELLDDDTRQSVSLSPDDGLTARVVAAALKEHPDVVLVMAPSGFLWAASATAVVREARGSSAQLAGVLDLTDPETDLSPLRSLGGGAVAVCAVVDPAQLSAASVRAAALLLAGQQLPEKGVLVPGQVVTTDDLSRLNVTSTSDLVPHLGDLRRRAAALSSSASQDEQADGHLVTTPWLPAADI